MLKEKNFFELFPQYTEEEILTAFRKLSKINKKTIEEIYGQDLKEKANLQNLTSKKKEIINTIINKSFKRFLEKKQSKNNSKTKPILTDNLIEDTFKKLKYKPLTKDEETKWLKRIKLSYYHKVDEKTKKLYLNYYFEIKPKFKEKYKQANAKEKKQLLKEAIEDAKIARELFIKNNEGLVLSVVKKINNNNIPKEDLFQEGNFGLIKAIERFNVEAENKFSTYAVWWIRHYTSRYIINIGETIRIPSNTYLKHLKILKATEDLYNNLHRKPTVAELSRETNIEENKIKEMQIKMTTLIPQSLSKKIREDKEETLEETIPDPNAEFEEKIEQKIIIDKIKKIIKKMDKNSQTIINMRTGLYDGKRYTLDEIAAHLGMTREKVRQIEIKIICTIKDTLEKQEMARYNNNLNEEFQRKNEEQETKEILKNIILSEINSLDEQTKQIIILKYKYKFSDKDIEISLNITREELIKREKKALLLIKKIIKNEQNSKQKRKQ